MQKPYDTHLLLPHPSVLLPQPSLPPLAAAAAALLLLLLGTAVLLSLALLLLLLCGLREGRALVGCLAAVSVWGWGVRDLCCNCCGAEDAAPCMHSTARHSMTCSGTKQHSVEGMAHGALSNARSSLVRGGPVPPPTPLHCTQNLCAFAPTHTQHRCALRYKTHHGCLVKTTLLPAPSG